MIKPLPVAHLHNFGFEVAQGSVGTSVLAAGLCIGRPVHVGQELSLIHILLKMEISQTAKLLYSLLLDRSTLSQKNKWQDDKGRIYIIYPIAEIAEILDKGSTTIKGALNELDMAGLLERERGGFSAPNRLYVKVPRVPQVQFSDQLMAGNPTLTEPENRPTDGQKTDLSRLHEGGSPRGAKCPPRSHCRPLWCRCTGRAFPDPPAR